MSAITELPQRKNMHATLFTRQHRFLAHPSGPLFLIHGDIINDTKNNMLLPVPEMEEVKLGSTRPIKLQHCNDDKRMRGTDIKY